jgi:tetratricopeptide (TPR) repeat protein
MSRSAPSDKSTRLDRYSRKDYTEIVDFPVEIVGRDSVVRRYSFEDSIRLYQRRITFASLRYRDADLVDAEVGHCRARIEQLRRSYFHKFGWATPVDEASPIDRLGPIAGEVAAFLCRVLRAEGRPDVRIEPVAGEGTDTSTWFVLPVGRDGLLLYVYVLGEGASDPARDRFFTHLKGLEAQEVGPDSEHLLAFHHTADCGLVLTSPTGEDLGADPDSEADPESMIEPTPWDEVLDVVRRGDLPRALTRCQELVQEQPWHREAYGVGAVLAVALDRPAAAIDLATLGTSYFPADPALMHYDGLARARVGGFADAVEPLEAALAIDPDAVATRLVLVGVLLALGRVADAKRTIAALRFTRPDEPRLVPALRQIEAVLRWRPALLALGGALVAAGVVGLGLGAWAGAVAAALGIAQILVVRVVTRLLAKRALRHPRLDDVTAGVRRARRSRADEPRVL